MRPPFAGAVLVGGAGSRLGGDKGNVEVEGVALAAHVVERLQAAGAEPIVLVGNRPIPALASAPLVADRWPGAGPLAAIGSTLGAEEAFVVGDGATPVEIVVIAACDQPGLSVPLLQDLVAALATSTDAGVAAPRTSDGRIHPFPTAWRLAAAEAVEALVVAGERRADGALAAVGVVEVPADPGDLEDLDTPEDVAAWTSRRSKRSRP